MGRSAGGSSLPGKQLSLGGRVVEGVELESACMRLCECVRLRDKIFLSIGTAGLPRPRRGCLRPLGCCTLHDMAGEASKGSTFACTSMTEESSCFRKDSREKSFASSIYVYGHVLSPLPPPSLLSRRLGNFGSHARAGWVSTSSECGGRSPSALSA